MNFSDFGNKLCSRSGILQLMDDIGRPLPQGVKPYRLGGGNPAMIPEISAMYRQEMEKIMSNGDEFEKLIGLYDSPQGRMSFIEVVAEYLSKTYGWKIGPENVAVSNGSQSACFYLFNLLSGTFTSDGKSKKKKILYKSICLLFGSVTFWVKGSIISHYHIFVLSFCHLLCRFCLVHQTEKAHSPLMSCIQ